MHILLYSDHTIKYKGDLWFNNILRIRGFIFMTTLYLIRHGQALGNSLRQFHGNTDGALTPIGYKQLDALSNFTKENILDIDVFYSSPLTRALETAKAVNKHYNKPITTDNDLMEIHGGDWEGVSWDDIMAKYPTHYEKWVNLPHTFFAPNGETMEQVYNRFVNRVNAVVKQHDGSTIAIFAHAIVIRCYIAYALNLGLEGVSTLNYGDNTNISKITFDENYTPTVCYYYNSSHLSDDISTFALRKKENDLNT